MWLEREIRVQWRAGDVKNEIEENILTRAPALNVIIKMHSDLNYFSIFLSVGQACLWLKQHAAMEHKTSKLRLPV